MAARRSLAAVTFQAVAREARVSQGAVQCHFRSIDSLRAEVVQLCGERIFEAISAHRDGEELTGGLAATWGMVEGSLVVASCLRILIEPLVADDSTAGPQTRAMAVQQTERWRETLRAELLTAQRKGALADQADPAMLTLTIQALLWAEPWASAVLGWRVSLEHAATAAWKVLAGAAADPVGSLPRLDARIGLLRAAVKADAVPPPLHPPTSPEWDDSDYDALGRRLHPFDVLMEVDDPARETFERLYGLPVGSSGPKAAARRARNMERAQRR